ncbi:unnamed protein product [[Candida] boidinii]|uniref:Unnamed protein product n=1 Tax=Candida boidinii TaxID=5477 RepID=A0ACB5U561_CANBO|nr:unnamed protein product [[Candida] boidinii]
MDSQNTLADVRELKVKDVCNQVEGCDNTDYHYIINAQNDLNVNVTDVNDWTNTFYFNLDVSNGTVCTPNFQVQWDWQSGTVFIDSDGVESNYELSYDISIGCYNDWDVYQQCWDADSTCQTSSSLISSSAPSSSTASS